MGADTRPLLTFRFALTAQGQRQEMASSGCDGPACGQSRPTYCPRGPGPEPLKLTQLTMTECGLREENSLLPQVWSGACNWTHHELGHPGHHPRPAGVYQAPLELYRYWLCVLAGVSLRGKTTTQVKCLAPQRLVYSTCPIRSGGRRLHPLNYPLSISPPTSSIRIPNEPLHRPPKPFSTLELKWLFEMQIYA